MAHTLSECIVHMLPLVRRLPIGGTYGDWVKIEWIDANRKASSRLCACCIRLTTERTGDYSPQHDRARMVPAGQQL